MIRSIVFVCSSNLREGSFQRDGWFGDCITSNYSAFEGCGYDLFSDEGSSCYLCHTCYLSVLYRRVCVHTEEGSLFGPWRGLSCERMTRTAQTGKVGLGNKFPGIGADRIPSIARTRRPSTEHARLNHLFFE
jgi:hypothetical protein